MSNERLPDDVQEALAAMTHIPDPNPVHLAGLRRGFLAEARRLREQRVAVSASPVIRLRKWIDILRRRKEANLMMTLAKAAVALIMILGTAGGVAYGADGSLPGQPLYPLDLGLEQAQMALAPTLESQAQLNLQITSERTVELIAMEQQGDIPDEASLTRLNAQIETTLRTLAKLNAEEMARLLAQLRALSQEGAAEMAQLGYGDGEQLMLRTQQEAQSGLDDPQGFQQRHRHGAGWQQDDTVEVPPPPTAPAPAATATLAPIQERQRNQDGSCQTGTVTCEPDRDRTRQQDRDQTQAGDGTGPVFIPTATPLLPDATQDWSGGENGQDGSGQNGGSQNGDGQGGGQNRNGPGR